MVPWEFLVANWLGLMVAPYRETKAVMEGLSPDVRDQVGDQDLDQVSDEEAARTGAAIAQSLGYANSARQLLLFLL
jgi:hypothetical protein